MSRRMTLAMAVALCAGLCVAPGCGGPGARTDAGAGSDANIAAPLACAVDVPADPAYGDATCPAALPAAGDLLDDALAITGLDRCTLSYGPNDLEIFGAASAHDPWRLPFYDDVHRAAVNAPIWTRRTLDLTDDAAASATPVADAIAVGAQRLGIAPPDPTCTAAYAIDGRAPLAAAVLELLVRLGEDTGNVALAGLENQFADVPTDLQIALAPVVVALGDAYLARSAVFSPLLTTPAEWELAHDMAPSLTLLSSDLTRLDPANPFWNMLLKDTDFSALYDAAARLAATVEAADLERFAGASGFAVAYPTSAGALVLRDAADHVHDTSDPALVGDVLLFVDTGGNDVYRFDVGANVRASNGVSVAVDLGGIDDYGYVAVPDPNDANRLPSDAAGRYDPPAPPDVTLGPISLSDASRFGAGRLGIGLLWDLGAEDDHYRSLRGSMGFGAFGVGVLYDGGGNDLYESEAGSLGAGIFGIGIALDAGDGDDVYEAYAFSQGFAYAWGFGLLHDSGGSDRYHCDIGDPAAGGDPLYFTSQRPGTGNSSFCQGAGFGRRADFTDFIFMSGGIGVLRDRGNGNDTYISSVFGMGTGYWYGTGVLSDEGGDDSYDGLWYVLGSAAHFALTIFWDEAGDDFYNQGGVACADPAGCAFAPAATAIGVGHDFSVGWHIDGSGDDIYLAPGLSLGAGNVNGLGLLINLGGADSYIAAGGPTLGAANVSDPGRSAYITAGLFIDTGGADLYDSNGATPGATDDATWEVNVQTALDPTIVTEHGVGLDGTGTVVLLP